MFGNITSQLTMNQEQKQSNPVQQEGKAENPAPLEGKTEVDHKVHQAEENLVSPALKITIAKNTFGTRMRSPIVLEPKPPQFKKSDLFHLMVAFGGKRSAVQAIFNHFFF